MDVAAILGNVTRVQTALSIVASLQLTSHLWPPPVKLEDGDCFDVIVVGAGSAGATLAARLAERQDINVLLLEAGDDPPLESLYPGLLSYLPKTRSDWNYTADAGEALYRNNSIPLTRGRMLGGSSGVNYMAYVRGGSIDYRTWSEAAGDSSWDWDAILPYFKKSEDLLDHDVLFSPSGFYHGTNGPVKVTRQPSERTKKYLKAFEEIGQDIVNDVNGEIKLGYAEPMYTIAQGRRQSSAYAFLRTPRNNLRVARNTLVTRVLFNEHYTAVGVRALVDGQEISLRATYQVVLSAGALNSPQLLQLSGIGPATSLAPLDIPVLVDLPVGYNLLDHTATLFAFATEKLTKPPPTLDPTMFPVPQFLGFATPNGSGSYPAYESENLITDSEGIIQFCSGAFGLRDDICERIYKDGEGRELLLSILLNLRGNSRGRVSLRSKNPLDQPHVDLGYYTAPEDIEAMVDYIEHYLQVFNSSYFQCVGAELLDGSPPECEGLTRWSRDYWRCYVRRVAVTEFHYGGTCSMGSVVDARLRVYGVENLRVADASIMPVLPGGNINAPCIMIGERAAEFVLEDIPPPHHFSRRTCSSIHL